MTINPDFSQVESDAFQVVVNRRYPIFYSEKRPFFMEANDLYGHWSSMTVTRRLFYQTCWHLLPLYLELFFMWVMVLCTRTGSGVKSTSDGNRLRGWGNITRPLEVFS